ncbi:MAG TPA: hypothetical protein VGR19_05585 [Allosphingosinicella sp.]|nr:hypothetical protein [Allosphingosinicella sp.]
MRPAFFVGCSMNHRLLFASALVGMPSSAAAQEIGMSLGGSFSSGRYGGTERVNLSTVVLGVSATYGRWRVDGTLPYVVLDSGRSAIEVGGIVVPGEAGGRTEGVGDAVLRLTSPTYSSGLGDVTWNGQVKLPTGAEALSTGKLDFSGDVELSHDVGAASPFVSVGYRTYGDSRFLELEDGFSLSAGTGITLGKTTLLASYDWAQSAVGGADPQEIFGLAAGEINQGWGWSIYGSKGLNSGAADFMLGAGLNRSFGAPRSARTRRIPR